MVSIDRDEVIRDPWPRASTAPGEVLRRTRRHGRMRVVAAQRRD